jgi:DUF4097 and DUF4098 domain-containing protein YvlB
MNAMHRLIAAILVIVVAAPAAAQDADSFARSIREAAEEIAREVEKAAQEAPAIAAIIRDTRITVERELKIAAKEIAKEAAQSGRNAGRGAAQAAREAERRRRDDARRGPELTENFSRTVRLGRDGTFSLENVSGDIEITGNSGNEVRIDAVKRVRHPDASEARAILEALNIDVSERGGSVDVRTEYSRYRYRRGGSGSIDFTVSVPRDASVTLKSISGDVRVTNVNGDLRAESTSGDIVTSNVRRIRLAKSISGDVDIAEAASDDLRAESVSGEVIMRNVKARVLSLEAVSGDVRLTDIDAERVQSRSVSGNVEYAGRLAPNGRYDLQTHSGSVRVTPANAQGFEFEARTFSGSFRSDYPTTIQGDSLAPRRGPGNRAVRGSIGGGGAMLTLQSFSGNITIVRR